MNLVYLLQHSASEFLTFVFSLFDFLGQISCFVCIFAFFYLFISKTSAYKYFIGYEAGFVVSSLIIKNIVKRPRPYVQDEALLSNRNSYGYSLPNERTMAFTISGAALTYQSKGRKKLFGWAFFGVICFAILVTFSQIYFAEGFLLDCLIGILIGLVSFAIVYKFVKVTNKTYFINMILSLLIFLIVFPFIAKETFTSNFSNAHIFEFLGLILSISVGCYLENKFIKYQIKNNLILTFFNASITLIFLLGYHFVCYLLPGIVVFAFIKYLVAGFVVSFVLPLLFKTFQKYFYIFSAEVETKKVVTSQISITENGTKKIARQIAKKLKIGDVVLLSGDLGAGKSVVVREILKSFGVKEHITSPTFTLVNEYNLPKHKCYHFDMYRLQDEEEAVNIGFDEILEEKQSIKFIEWPQMVEGLLPKKYKKITITKLSKKTRNIVLEDYI